MKEELERIRIEQESKALAHAGRVAGVGSYLMTEQEFFGFLERVTNPKQVEFVSRSLEEYPPCYAWDILLKMMRKWFDWSYPNIVSKNSRDVLGPILIDVFLKKFPNPKDLNPPTSLYVFNDSVFDYSVLEALLPNVILNRK